MKLIIHGYNGRMGRELVRIIKESETDELVAAIDVNAAAEDFPTFRDITDFEGTADCVIDFSHHTAAPKLAAYAAERKIPLVLATTGHTEDELCAVRRAAGSTPVFLSANMSVGVAVLASLARKAAAMFPGADIEIVEKHHNQKLDVPSGTALMLAESVRRARPEAEFLVGRHENGKRTQNEIGIHSLRLGNVVGEHEVIINTGTETITLKHEAASRSLFADGALHAAAFLVGKAPGLYNMENLVNA